MKRENSAYKNAGWTPSLAEKEQIATLAIDRRDTYRYLGNRVSYLQSQKNFKMNDSIGRILLFVLELCFAAAAVVNVPLATGSSLGSKDFVVAKAGDRVVLRCPLKEENNCPIWTRYSPGYHGQSSGGDRELNDCDGVFSNFSERLSVEKTATASILTITNVKREDAGKYQCEDEDVSIEVIVIDEGPKCSSTVRKIFRKKMGKEGAIQTKSKTKLHCKVGVVSGSLNATSQCILEWRIAGREDVLINSSKCIVGDNSVKATLTLDAASHSNDTSYVCVVRGSDSGVKQYSCQTGPIETPLTTPKNKTVKPLNMKVRQSFFDFVQNFLNAAKPENRIRRLQRPTLCSLSKLLQLKKGCDPPAAKTSV